MKLAIKLLVILIFNLVVFTPHESSANDKSTHHHCSLSFMNSKKSSKKNNKKLFRKNNRKLSKRNNRKKMNVKKRVESVGFRIIREIKNFKNSIKFTIINKNSINAHIMPWGEVKIHKGMVNFTKKDSHLALVLAHELAHLKLGHFKRLHKLEHSFDGKNTNNMNEKVNKELLKLELEADELALHYIAEAGYNPYDGIRFLKHLKDNTISKNNNTHPTFSARIKNLKNHCKSAERIYSKKISLNINKNLVAVK